MQVVLITPPTTASCEVQSVNRMLDAGLPVLHLRKPEADRAAIQQYLHAIKPQYLNRVVLHQHHSLAEEWPLKVRHALLAEPTCAQLQTRPVDQALPWCGRPHAHPAHLVHILQGIHFKERNRPLQPPLPRVVAPGLTQSTSLHSLKAVRHDWQNLDYAFLSPVFDSISKQGYTAAAFDPQELSDALQHAHMPVYALGGVSVDKVALVHSMGFRGIGLLGAVWGSADPPAALQPFLDAANAS